MKNKVMSNLIVGLEMSLSFTFSGVAFFFLIKAKIVKILGSKLLINAGQEVILILLPALQPIT